MKITHICLNGPVTDGWTYQDNLLPKYHKRRGYDVSVITSKYIRNKKAEIVIDDRDIYFNEFQIKTIRLKNKFNTTLKSKFKLFKGLYKTISNEDPDILFVHGVQFLNIIDIIKYLKRNRNVITYVDNHADFSNSATNWISKNILHKIIWKKCANLIEPYVTKFYGVLPARVDFLKNVYNLPEHKIELLVMGADDEEVVKAKNREVIDRIRFNHNIKPDDFLVITGGKIDNAKRQTLLLMQAINEINRENIKLIVFGSVIDELKDDMQRLVDGEKIQYIGWIPGQESYKYFAASDLGVFPGRHSVLWEQAVGTGLPCIFKYWKGTTHVDVGGNCLFLYSDTAEEIKEKLNYVINQSDVYENMKLVAEQLGLKKFSYFNIAKRSIETK